MFKDYNKYATPVIKCYMHIDSIFGLMSRFSSHHNLLFVHNQPFAASKTRFSLSVSDEMKDSSSLRSAD